MNTPQPADFRALQSAFTAFIRHPDSAPIPPGCDADRMRLYHTLFFNNFDGVLETALERFKASLTADEWLALVKPFFSEVPQHSPFLADVPLRFADYVAEGSPVPLNAAQIELLIYEAALHECRIGGEGGADQEGAALSPPDSTDDLLAATLRPHPASQLLECAYPVHDPAFDPLTAPPAAAWLWLMRDAEGVVQTTVLSAASARWLMLLDAHAGQAAVVSLAELAAELGQSPTELVPFARQQLEHWVSAGWLIAAPATGEEQ